MNAHRRVALATSVGSVTLANPVLTAAGTSGHGAELDAYVPLDRLGAVVVKSLAAFAWDGNAAPRVVPDRAAMLNSVGLQGPGVEAWLEEWLPELERRGARVIASIWGRSVEDFAKAAAALAGAPDCLVALEVNISCPNVEDRDKMFAHSQSATEDALSASAAAGLPCWAKLSPNVANLVEIAAAACRGGAEALTLVNTVFGIAIDPDARRPLLGATRGGISGPALLPVALRAVYDCREALPDVGIVGAGGVFSGRDAAALLVAGANAVEVGTATLADPRAPLKVLRGLERWCRERRIDDVTTLIGTAHAA